MGAKQYTDVKDYVRLSRIVGVVVSLLLSAIYIIGARAFFRQFFQDEEAISQGVSYTYVAAMRGMGDVKSPRIMATICVLIICPVIAFTLTHVLNYGVWGIWIASLTNQTCWFTMSCIKEHQCLQKVLSLNP